MPLKKQEGQDNPVLLTWVPDKWPVGQAIFHPRDVIWTSHLNTSKDVSSQLAFQFRSSK